VTGVLEAGARGSLRPAPPIQIPPDREKALAVLTAENPTYAAYLVNRELASKVQIAVLPLGTESGVLGNMLQSTLGAPSAPRPKR